MATAKLIGATMAALTTPNGANYIVMSRYAASASGHVTEILARIANATAGNVTIGIYADSSGAPAALLATSASTAVSSDVERNVTIALASPLQVTSGTYYWIAFNSSANLVGAKNIGGTRLYKSTAYGALPDPAGTGYSSDTVYTDLTAGWGGWYLYPTGIASVTAFGVPVMGLSQAVLPTGLASGIVFGSPTVKLAWRRISV